MALNELRQTIFQRVQRELSGVFIWRCRSEPDGSCVEDFISEGSSYQVMDMGLFLKQPGQAPKIFSHSDLTKADRRYLLIDRGTKSDPALRFLFEDEERRLIYTSDDVEQAGIIFFLNSGDDRHMIALAFFQWLENERVQSSFLGGTQQRLIDHLRGVQHLMRNGGGLYA